jgi:hypothetical protein
MRKILLIMILCRVAVLNGQSIKKAEYYIDTDPGLGSGIALNIVSGKDISIVDTLHVNTLPDGLHIAYIRAKDDSGNWSLPYSYPFVKAKNAPNSMPDITYAEFSIDTASANGSGTPVSLSSGKDINSNFTASLSAYNNGFHVLYIRARDANYNWSLNYTKFFLKDNLSILNSGNISRIEYYIDTDPGAGLGNNISFSPGSSVDTSFSADLTSVADGFHVIYIRAKDQFGKWSILSYRPFLKENNNISGSNNITGIEYFIDTDPGYGHGTAFSLASAPEIILNDSVSLATVSEGFHILYIRAKDQYNKWSLQSYRPFVKENNSGTVLGNITKMEYYFDTDPGYGLGQSFSILPGNDLTITDTASISALSMGFHNLYIRAKDQFGKWSLSSYKPFLKDGSNHLIPADKIVSIRYYITSANGTVIMPAHSYSAFTPDTAIDVSFHPKTCVPDTNGYFLHSTALTSNNVPSIEYVQPFHLSTPNIAPAEQGRIHISTLGVNFSPKNIVRLDTAFHDINATAGADTIRYSWRLKNNLASVQRSKDTISIHSINGMSGKDTLYLTAYDTCGYSVTDTIPMTISTMALPVELLSFTAKRIGMAKRALLSWKTASEINNDYFAIELSDDAANWETIGRVKGTGTNNEQHAYEFIDETPHNGVNYYRLHQVDYNGAFENSDVRTVNIQDNNEYYSEKVSPNPFRDNFFIELSTKVKAVAEVVVLNAESKLIDRQILNLSEGLNHFSYSETDKWSPGVYIIKIRIGDQQFNHKLVKI